MTTTNGRWFSGTQQSEPAQRSERHLVPVVHRQRRSWRAPSAQCDQSGWGIGDDQRSGLQQLRGTRSARTWGTSRAERQPGCSKPEGSWSGARLHRPLLAPMATGDGASSLLISQGVLTFRSRPPKLRPDPPSCRADLVPGRLPRLLQRARRARALHPVPDRRHLDRLYRMQHAAGQLSNGYPTNHDYEFKFDEISLSQ
jgi:hypothetical protein